MPEIKEARAIIQKVLALAEALPGSPQTEVQLGGGRLALTRFAENAIHQNVEESNLEVSVRVLLDGGRSARAATNRLTDEGLSAVVARALALARLNAPDPEMLPLYAGSESERTKVFETHVDAATDAFGPMDRAKAVVDVIAEVKKAGLKCAGRLSTRRGSIGSYGETGMFAMGNSEGLFRFYDSTRANFSLTVMGENSSSWSTGFAGRIGELDLDSMARRAIRKAKESADPVAVDPGEWTVILEPRAVAALVSFLGWGMSGQSFLDGNAWTSGRKGKAVMGKNFHLSDDPFDPRAPSRPFDGEGVPTKALELVKGGVLNAIPWDRKAARRAGVASTGHGAVQPSDWSGGPGAMVVAGGEASVEDLIRSTKKGILVTQLWYNRLVEPKDVVVTGMTRNGTFLIRDGELVKGVKNLRYNQSVLAAFRNIAALGRPERAGGMIVPAMKIDGFRFSSVTRF